MIINIDLPALTNKHFLKTRLLIFAMYMIVNLTELNLFLFIYFTYFTLLL